MYGILFFTSIGNTIDVETYVEILKISVVGVLGLNLFFSLKMHRLKLYHPYIIFLGTLSLFILSRILLDVLTPYVSFEYTVFLSNYKWSYSVQIRLLQNIIISLIALQIGASFALNKLRGIVGEENRIKPEMNWQRLGLLLFYVGLPFLMYQYLEMAMEIMSKGYLALHKGEIVYRNSFLTTLFSRFSLVGFFIYLAGIPKNKSLYFNLFIFIVFVLVPKLLQGMRGPVMCTLLILFWFVYYINNHPIKIRYLLLFIVSMILVNNFMTFFRLGEEYKRQDQMLVRFFYQQGVSLQVLGYSIEHEEELAEYRFVNMFANTRVFIDDVIARFSGEKRDLTPKDIKEEYGYLGYWVTDIVNPDMFKQGFSNGGSYLAEYYLIGRELGQFIGSFFIGFFTIIFVERGRRNRFGLLLLFFFLPSWIFVPRDSTFDFITDNISNALFAFASILLMGLLLMTFNRNNQRKISDEK